jgi:hypothetical protein
MRTDRYRFTRWVDSRRPNGPALAVELYDHGEHPRETTNVADRRPKVVERLTDAMKRGWKGALPRTEKS